MGISATRLMWCVPAATSTCERQCPCQRVDTSSVSRAIARCPTSIVKTTLTSRLPIPLLRPPLRCDGQCGVCTCVFGRCGPEVVSQFCQSRVGCVCQPSFSRQVLSLLLSYES